MAPQLIFPEEELAVTTPRQTEYDVLASLVGRYRPNDDKGSKIVL